jgi:hypothetical protein
MVNLIKTNKTNHCVYRHKDTDVRVDNLIHELPLLLLLQGMSRIYRKSELSKAFVLSLIK